MRQEYTDVFDELLRTTQVIRKNAIGNETRALLDKSYLKQYGRTATDEEAELFLATMFPWVFGESSIMHILTRPDPTGMDLYNALSIAHYLDKTGMILTAYNTYGRYEELPEPDIRICLEE